MKTTLADPSERILDWFVVCFEGWAVFAILMIGVVLNPGVRPFLGTSSRAAAPTRIRCSSPVSRSATSC